jgi:hypothetical protein
MNRKDIIRMAQETGVMAERVRDLVNFAALVASAEREACAELCEMLELPEWPDKVRQPLAQAIRARSKE